MLHVAQRILRSLAVELVDRDEIGEIEHVDLLELGGRAEFRRHDVERHIRERHDPRFALSYTGGLDHHQIEAGELAAGDHFGKRGGELRSGIARREGAHENPVGIDGVHADAIPEERTAGALARGIDGNHRDPSAILLIETQPQNQLIGERGLARPAGAGDAEHGHLDARGGLQQRLAGAHGVTAILDRGDDARELAAVPRAQGRERIALRRRERRQIVIARADHIVDHPLQAQLRTVLGGVKAGHPVGLQLADFARDDDPAAAAEHLDVLAAVLAQ